jgi:phosphatidylinositol alpha 1,6-mannosyltransferase
MDLMGDDAKRRAFAEAAHASVQGRTWSALGAELVGHYKAVTREPAVAHSPLVALSSRAAKQGF